MRTKQADHEVAAATAAATILEQAEIIQRLEDSRPNLVAEISDFVGAGISDSYPHAFPAGFVITVINRGGSPSIARNWGIAAECEGRRYTAPLTVLDETITLAGIVNGKKVAYKFSEVDSIFNKTAIALAAGAMVQGTLFALFEPVDREAFQRGVLFTIRFEDYLGREKTAAYLFNPTNRPNRELGYHPGVKPTRIRD